MRPHPLETFHAGIAAIVRDDRQPDLSARQIDVLLRVHQGPPQTCTIRGLAAAMHVSKPAITRATDRLTELGLVKRVPDIKDRRSVFVAIELRGQAFVERLATALAEPARKAA